MSLFFIEMKFASSEQFTQKKSCSYEQLFYTGNQIAFAFSSRNFSASGLHSML